MKIGQLLMTLCLFFSFSNLRADVGRAPTNYVPDMEISYQFDEDGYFVDSMLDSDYSGILGRMKKQLEDRRLKSEFIDHYDLSSIPGNEVASSMELKPAIEKAFLKYLDKKLQHKLKNAPKGSALARVHTVKSALRSGSIGGDKKVSSGRSPAEVPFFSKFKMKYRLKIFRGRGYIILANPYVDANAEFTFSGQMKFNLAKRFNELGIYTNFHYSSDVKEFNFSKKFNDLGINTSIKYHLDQESWIAEISRKITDNIVGKITSNQSDRDMMFSGSSDRRVELIYKTPF